MASVGFGELCRGERRLTAKNPHFLDQASHFACGSEQGFAFSFIGFVVKILAGNNQSSSISQGINARASKKLI